MNLGLPTRFVEVDGGNPLPIQVYQRGGPYTLHDWEEVDWRTKQSACSCPFLITPIPFGDTLSGRPIPEMLSTLSHLRDGDVLTMTMHDGPDWHVYGGLVCVRNCPPSNVSEIVDDRRWWVGNDAYMIGKFFVPGGVYTSTAPWRIYVQTELFPHELRVALDEWHENHSYESRLYSGTSLYPNDE